LGDLLTNAKKAEPRRRAGKIVGKMRSMRFAARKPCRQTAKIVTDSGTAIGCTVADLSSTGAKLLVSSDVSQANMPDSFWLTLKLDGVSVRCRAAWRGDGCMGVQFTSPMQPMAVQPPRRNRPKVPAQAPRKSLFGLKF